MPGPPRCVQRLACKARQREALRRLCGEAHIGAADVKARRAVPERVGKDARQAFPQSVGVERSKLRIQRCRPHAPKAISATVRPSNTNVSGVGERSAAVI
jgi:hypothetical protein